MERSIICKRCLKEIGKEQAKRSTTPKKGKLCNECKDKYITQHKQRLKERNANLSFRSFNKKRMTDKNPMKRIEVAEKVSSKLKERYESGELKSAFSDPEKLKEIRKKSKKLKLKLFV